MGTGLSKSRFVTGWKCHNLLWWTVHEPDAPELVTDKVLQDRFDMGTAVGERARAEAGVSDRPTVYALEDLWGDTGSGHKIEQTVFIECSAEYRKSGPEYLKPLGETEFVADAAAQSARGPKGSARISAIIGFADLGL